MATPAKRGLAPTPPDKGSFPLDHFGECRPFQADYLACVRQSTSQRPSNCKPLMKLYLECRMTHGLMAQEDLNQLGFRDTEEAPATTAAAAPASAAAAPATKKQ